MTNFEIQPVNFDKDSVSEWARRDPRKTNWPVVYTINDSGQIYVGETTNAELRMRQHLASSARKHLTHANVILDESFNKSVCLDLESHLIKYFHADGKYEVLNGNGGITDADYFDRERYRIGFDAIFQQLIESGQLTRSIPEIVNSDLFKYSPFKSLNNDQAIVIEEVLESLFNTDHARSIVVQGDPGTGKTIVAVYLMKLLVDIGNSSQDEDFSSDTMFWDFFQEGYREQAKAMKIGLVIPQISLRETLRKVFKRTPGLDEAMVLEPFEIGLAGVHYDLLIVDEAHRLQQRNNQPAAERNIGFREINEDLFGVDDKSLTQLDWVLKRSTNQIFLLDKAQSVKPADLPARRIDNLVENAKADSSCFALTSQMRVSGGEDYIAYVGDVLAGTYSGNRKTFGEYDLRLLDSFIEMQKLIASNDRAYGLSRILAGYAWPWLSKGKDGASHDWEIEGIPLKWNSVNKDWINAKNSANEVGGIHTIQGYDLNFAGVVIGPDLGYDPKARQVTFHRENYHDKKGKENNPTLGITYSDEDLKEFVVSIYRVLMTRGIQGTYVYVVDPSLREYLRKYF